MLPAAWVAEATTFKIQQPAAAGSDLEKRKKTSEWHQGYCYQFWRCRHNGFRGDGALDNTRSSCPTRTPSSPSPVKRQHAGELNLFWDHLLPAIHEQALPPDRKAQAQLEQRLSSLALLPPAGGVSSPVAVEISGKVFELETNTLQAQTISFDFKKQACVFALKDGKGNHPITCGLGKWVDRKADMPGTPPKLTSGDLGPVSKVLAGGVWKDDDTFEMTWRFYETPHHDTVICRFDGNKLRVEFLSSVGEKMRSQRESRPTLEGRLAG